MSKTAKSEMRLETITPKRAADDLDKSEGKNYRQLTDKRATVLAETILAGRWEVNGETIKYNCDGRVVDGQHRLMGVVIANKPIETWVCYGIAHDENIDTGVSRRLTDLLKKRGEISTRELSGAIGWLWRRRHGGWDRQVGHAIPHSESLAILDQTPTLRNVVAKVLAMVPESIGMHAMLTAMMTEFAEKDVELANWFIDKLGGGVELKEDDPVRRLRERLAEDKSSKRRLMTKEKAALVIVAWNLTRQGRSCKFVRWNGTGPAAQPFPIIE